ncbi:MAG: ribonuclease Z [Candidatus Methanoplasma sp.]|jgi:ribonuclease Z|nr:ribonuclease Z [Candidatus Methanoplasma sp.]
MLDILFLGTGASIPSRDRGMPAVAVRCGTETVLFDCGEGTQRQMMVSPFSFMKIKGIFITHMHGDHFLGLPGLIQTMGLSGRKEKLFVCGPEGLSDAVNTFLSICEGEIGYDLETIDMVSGDRLAFGGFSVTAFRTEHTVPSLGYKFTENESRGRFDRKKAAALGIRPGPDFSRLHSGEPIGDVTPDMVIGPPRSGCSVVYSGDTVPCRELSSAAMGADVLIHESTFSGKESELAETHRHSTAVQAAETARDCGCRVLFMVHTSNRYDIKDTLAEEAERIFADSLIPDDMTLYRVSKEDIRSV